MFRYFQRRRAYPSEVNYAPDVAGVYGIFGAGANCIYVGSSTYSIQGRLIDHVRGSGNTACINSHVPTFYVWETADEIAGPIAGREQELIRYYKSLGEAYCNDVI